MPPTSTFSSKDEQSVRKKSPQTDQPVITPLSSETIRRVRVGVFDISPTQALALQRTIGNYAVQRLLESARSASISPSPSTPAIQPKPASNTIQRDTDDSESEYGMHWQDSYEDRTESEDVDSVIDGDMYDDDEGLYDDSAFDWDVDEDGNERIRPQPVSKVSLTRPSGHQYIDPLDPTSTQVKRKVGLGKALGWNAVLLGARIGDFVRSRFPNQPRHEWTNRAKAGYANTGVKARNKLRAKNAKRDFKKHLGEEIVNDDPDNPIYFKDLKKSEQRRMLKEGKRIDRRENREFKKRLKGYQKPQMVSF